MIFGTQNRQQLFCLMILFPLLFSCGLSTDEQKKTQALEEIQEIAEKINHDFLRIRNEAKSLADQTAAMYQNPSAALAQADPKKYRMHPSGVFYKPEDDGGAAVFVSGAVPVDRSVKEIVYFTEPLDALLKKISQQFPEVAQSYYNDRNSYNRIYPFFDVLIQYEPKLEIPSFNFYYLADEKHNPAKKAVWVEKPYVDPAGRGWMVSVIAPVYVNDRLEGVCGIDVTVSAITRKYISEKGKNLLIVDAGGDIVSIHEQLNTLFSLPPLTNHKYIDTILADTYLPDDYNLLANKVKPVRQMATELITNRKTEHRLALPSGKYTTLSVSIPELNWRIIRVMTP